MLKSLALYSFFIIISLGFFTISSRVIKSEEGVQDDYRHTGGGGTKYGCRGKQMAEICKTIPNNLDAKVFYSILAYST